MAMAIPHYELYQGIIIYEVDKSTKFCMGVHFDVKNAKIIGCNDNSLV